MVFYLECRKFYSIMVFYFECRPTIKGELQESNSFYNENHCIIYILWFYLIVYIYICSRTMQV